MTSHQMRRFKTPLLGIRHSILRTEHLARLGALARHAVHDAIAARVHASHRVARGLSGETS
jgi:hypothetical protein